MSTIKLDYDDYNGGINSLALGSRIAMMASLLEIELVDIRACTTSHGCHVYIATKNEIDDRILLAMQAILGSDWRREMYNMKRVWFGVKSWNVLFMKKYKSGAIVSEEKYAKRLTEELNSEFLSEAISWMQIEPIESVNAIYYK